MARERADRWIGDGINGGGVVMGDRIDDGIGGWRSDCGGGRDSTVAVG